MLTARKSVRPRARLADGSAVEGRREGRGKAPIHNPKIFGSEIPRAHAEARFTSRFTCVVSGNAAHAVREK